MRIWEQIWREGTVHMRLGMDLTDVAPSIARTKDGLKHAYLSFRKMLRRFSLRCLVTTEYRASSSSRDIPTSEYSCPSPARPSYSTYTKGLIPVIAAARLILIQSRF
ncbi:hypothetical protein ARMGADRAFT_56338 [Armillaria gallica]|uniref:Uncharacterized protein n=1 Tax=Armillaria gallica TaxID=47427 RepID=A0A2H3EW52_ARMGA|nr:hypothetical protein ARMGADRAFT_56338 [Armillaria gallica]